MCTKKETKPRVKIVYLHFLNAVEVLKGRKPLPESRTVCPNMYTAQKNIKGSLERSLQTSALQHNIRGKFCLGLGGEHMGLGFVRVWDVRLMFVLQFGISSKSSSFCARAFNYRDGSLSRKARDSLNLLFGILKSRRKSLLVLKTKPPSSEYSLQRWYSTYCKWI